ncbi:hypothetical protein [Clostridium sp.]|jgi:hypothetical protein|uniref:hypothetical protein n=1 Tax=Clostridium sp. TaxID=1506 RepID=UPI003A2A1637
MDNIPDCQYDYHYEAPKAQIIDTCIDCGNFIYEGEGYYDIRGIILCEDCMREYKNECKYVNGYLKGDE